MLTGCFGLLSHYLFSLGFLFTESSAVPSSIPGNIPQVLSNIYSISISAKSSIVVFKSKFSCATNISINSLFVSASRGPLAILFLSLLEFLSNKAVSFSIGDILENAKISGSIAGSPFSILSKTLPNNPIILLSLDLSKSS